VDDTHALDRFNSISQVHVGQLSPKPNPYILQYVFDDGQPTVIDLMHYRL